MDYKKIIPNQNIRFKLLKLMDFLPDKIMVKMQYKIATGNKLNLKNPTKFTEKIQWYKLNYRDPLMIQCSDKYNVRKFVESKGLSEILVPLYGVYKDANDINFNDLPSKFVLKTTNASKTNIICKDKSKLNIKSTKQLLNKWINDWEGKMGREWAYYDIEPQIICEKYLEPDKNGDLVDYKFFCFNGEVYSLYVIVDRFKKEGMKLGIFDTDFKQLPYKRVDINILDRTINKPENFDKMLEIAKSLSSDFPHVRVDLYNIDGEIHFGELTFYNGSGYKGYIPEDFDYKLGELFDLKKVNENNMKVR